jgi:manganese/zinc/iron transport system substrate-binding protein
MGHGIDPHTHEPSPGDLQKISSAEMIFFHGLHFESRFTPALKETKDSKKVIVNVSDNFPREKLISAGKEEYDPHVWFDIELWKISAKHVKDALSAKFPENKDLYEKNFEKYNKQLDELQEHVKKKVAEIEDSSTKILVTVHDAFSYFARNHGFEVKGLQGVTTETEVSTKDISSLAEFIVKKNIKAIFPEASIQPKVMTAIKDAVREKSKQLKGTAMDIKVGKALLADSIGQLDTEQGTYIGMYKYNVATIVDNLK